MAEYSSLFADEAEPVDTGIRSAIGDGYTSLFADEAERSDATDGANRQNSDSNYGFTERRQDEITARTGRDASAGQVYAEGLLPGVRATREGMDLTEDRNLAAFLDRSALRDAEDRRLLQTNYMLRGYKAKDASAEDTSRASAVATNLPVVGLAVEGVRGAARMATAEYMTDVLENYARDARISEADIEKAREYSQGDAEKMNEYFANIARARFGERAAKKGEAQRRMAAAGEEGFWGKVGGGTLGMIPMMEEFALTGAAGKALGIGAKAVQATWRGRVVAGLAHSAWMTPVMGAEMTRRRYKELTAPEYHQNPETGELEVIPGDDPEKALAKAAKGGFGEAAIFSLPIGEAAFGWAPGVIGKSIKGLRGADAAWARKAAPAVKGLYENYVKYGQLTGLRGQPQMLALMDLNTFKDQVLGYGKKDSEYEGLSKEWDKFTNGEDLPDGTHVPGVLSLKGQTDLFVGALGVMLFQAGTAGMRTWRDARAQKASYDRRLQGAFKIPQEQLDQMNPDLKRWLVRIGDRLYSGEDAFGGDVDGARTLRREQQHGRNFKGERYDRVRVVNGEVTEKGTFEERLRNWCDKVGKKLGMEAGQAFEQAGKYALQFDNSAGWERSNAGSFQSQFRVPRTLTLGKPDENGKMRTTSEVAWQDVEIPVGDGVSIAGKTFTDANTGISVTKWPLDASKADGRSIYLVEDGNGRRATRYGAEDAFEAANAMSRLGQKTASERDAKAAALKNFRDQYRLGGVDFYAAKDGAEFDKIVSEGTGRPHRSSPGEQAVTLPDGTTVYCLDRMETPQQMKRNVLHEAGRHRGLDVAFETPADKIGFVAGLARSGDPVVQNQLNRIVGARMARGEIERPEEIFKRDKDGNYLHANALEEVYAHLFDREDVPDEPGWWDEHVNVLRRNLRKVFNGLSYSRSEAEEVYRGAMNKLAEQTGGNFYYEPEPPNPPTPTLRALPDSASAERLQGEVDAARTGHRVGFRAAEKEFADQIGEERDRRAATRRGQEERARQRQEAADYEEQERQRIERERREEQDARDEAELQQLIDAEERESDMAKREEYQRRRREITERRARERAIAKENAEAEAVRAAQERENRAQEREAQRRAGYEAADAQARLDRKNAVKEALREDDARRAEKFDRAEEERKRREAEDNASVLPRIAVEPEAPQGKERTSSQGDVLRASYGPNGNQIVARRVTDGNGKVIGWDVNAVANDGTETLIASTTKPKKDGMAAIRAVRRQIHDHFGLPYGKEAEKAMEAELVRVEEQARKETADEAGRRADEAPAQPEQGASGRQEGGEAPRPVEAEPEGAEAPSEGVVVHHANEGRLGDGVRAAEDALAGLFGDMPQETPVEAPRSEAGAEGAMTRPERAEGAEGRNSPSGGESRDIRDIMSRWGLTDPSAKFFDVNEELGSDRRDKNWELVRDIAALYDQKKIRGFYDFAKMFKAANPAWYAEQKDGLRRLWNYAAETTGLFDRVGDYEARDAIRSADEGRNVRDISGINALQAALQDIDVEMYPAAKLDSSDARVPNTKLAADPKTGIVPGNELKGRPRSLLSKPILGVEFEDGTVSVGTGRHRKELYERYGMDIPMRRVREADGWVTKKPDGTYDFTKIRLLDALDNIQDSKGSTEDYVAFFGDVKIPRAEAEREGFLGSKEARQAYAIANDATEDLRASVNFEGGRVEGKIKPEQAAAIAEIAPIGEGKANADLQRYLLKSVLRDPTLDRRDLGIKASEAKHLAAMKREADGVEQMAFDFFGDDTVEKAAEKAEKYRSEQAAKYSRLAKSLREVQRSRENDLVKKKILREDMRALGINERKIAEGGKAKEAELQKAIDKATLEKMRWESINLDPDLRAQMEKDLGMEPSAPKEGETPARPDFALESVTQGQINDEARRLREREALQRRMDAPLKGGSMETGQGLLDLGGAEGEDLFNRTIPATEAAPAKPAFERGQVVMFKNAAGNMREATFLQDNGDGTATVRVKTPGANRYAPTKVEDMKMSLSALHDEGLVNRGLTQAERDAIRAGEADQGTRFFDKAEEAGDFDKRQYAPAKYKVPGAVKSRTLLEEPPALRATEPPDNKYKLMIPEKHIKNGDLQEHQLEFVGYAGRAHGMKDANGSPLGMMGGYGTGAGKSRMIAGTILDNRWRGRKRALWITTQRGLIDDVRSEVKPFGMEGLVEDIGDKPMPKDGIGFTTYSDIRNEGVVEKIANELGKDFDGVIAFDEIHRAKTEGGRTQDAVVKLQELLPKARVIYMSATGATDVGNLGYATRLGLWGEGTPFKDFEDFKKKVEGKGVSAMEMVAQTLKRRGQYLSANLSKEGVEFDHVAVPTTEAQKRTYTEYNHALSDVYRGVYDALEVLGRLDYTVPPSSLHGMQQRLHYSMVTALKIPALIERAKKELAKGNAPVFSLVNTNEAGSTREVAKALEEGRQLGMDEVNFGPKQILLDFLTKEGDKTYQKQEGAYKDYQFPTMKPVKDQSGEVVGFERDPIADGIRRRLVREVEKLPDTFGNPINMIIDAFGKDNVANLTGLNKGGMAEDYRAFQNGDKKVLVFSGVANTGYTFSSDRKYKNQARRVAFPLQLGYRADELEQTLGRVHRNNQANAPIYVTSTTDLPGERRFYSSVERRRGQMKALTTGDRAATGNGITSEGDNFETKYAQQAVDQIIAMLHKMGKLDDIARDMNFVKRVQRPDGSVVEVNGMLKRDKSGATVPDVSAKRFLNRLLMLDPKKQDGMFTAFKNLLDQNIRWAKEDGEYDIGLQDIGSTHNDAVRSVKLADDMDVQHVNSWFKTDKVPFDDFARDHAAEFLTYVRNKRTGETFAVRADGKMGKRQEPAAMRFAVDGTKKRMKASILDTEKPNAAYEKLDTAKAKELWDAEYGVIPEERADDGFYATGDLLKHWNDVLGSKPPRTFRVKAGDAPEYIGAKIDTDEIPAVFGRFGKAQEARDMVIDGKVREVLNNRTVDLVNGWTLKQVPRDGAKKVMVRGVEPGQIDAVAKELGGEVSKKRIFMEPDAAKLRKIIEKHPANLYRDDEKIGDTGNLRFFNIDEEAGRRVHAKGRDEAERMEGAGAGRREIWEKTGWWRAKDGKWRYEIAGISDADTKRMLDFALASGKFYDRDRANTYSFTLNDLEAAMKAKGERLPDSVKTLLAAYPRLGKETIEVDRKAEQPKDGTLGYATKGKIHLYERGTTAETLNHELQHRIQAASGMAGGTNTDGKSFGRYTQEHGEWEARQAATRARMSAEERGKTAPWETADRHNVAEDMTQIDDANRARIRPDGEPKEPEPVAPAADRKTTIAEKAKTELADRYDPIKKMEIATGRRDKKDLYAENSPYNAMRLLHGHNEAARQRYEKIWKRPFEDMLRKSGATVDDVGMYMIATNAKDRNRKVMERSGTLDGAGLSDADAAKILSDLRSHLGADKVAKIEEMANFLWKMQDEGMERRVESGRVARETADQWRKEEPFHVPMRDDLSDEGGEYNRSTRQWRRSDFKEANGRYTLPDNPVEFMFKEYQDAMYGSNINEARRVLADFVRSTPGVGKVRKGVRRGKAWSFTHKQIEDFPDPNYHEQTVKGGSGRPNLVAFKEGGNLYMIELNGKQGERVAEAVIGRGVQNMWKPVAAFTRGYASTATELSPAFLGRNFAADMLEASLNTMADKGVIRGGVSAVRNVANAVRMAGTIRKYIKTGKFEGPYADVMRRYVESGASIGGMGNEGYTELKNDLGKVASGKHGVMDVLRFVGRGISEINKQGELATRLAVFKDYIDGGASDGEAAMRSREYSTDFNKYGNQRWMNSAWMFSGSVIGGAIRQTASLATGKHGRQLAMALFTYGVMEAMAEHFFNADDDKKARKSGEPSGETMTEFQRANSLYFRMGDKFIRVPFHAGPFSVLKYAGNLAARAALGDISGADAAKHIGKEALDSGMHFTGTGDFNSDTPVQSLLPTLLVPFYQLKGNEDYAGRPIRKQMFSETKPYSENGRKQTGDVWKSMARGMNKLTGGNERRRGWFDYSPENYKFVVDSALKNLGRDITTVSDFVTDLKEGKDLDNSHIPFWRDYVRDVPDNAHNFYEAERRYKVDRADGTIKAGSRRDEKIRKLLNDIRTLRHWEDGEEREGGRWVRKRNPSEATKKKYEKTRLRYQQQVIDLMRPKK